MNLKLTKIYFSVQDYLMILFGTLLYGFGFNAFILSNEIVTGGVSGICALIFFASNGLIPVSVSYFVINVALLVVALKILGLKFLIKTIFGVFSLSASLSLFEWLLKGQPILHDGYSRKPVKVVVLLAKKSESVSIFRIVKRIDHQAFISQSIVRGVYGEGFDQIKT